MTALETASRLSVALVVVAAPLLIAGRPGWAVVVLALAAAVALALGAHARAPVATDRASLVLFAALGGGTLWTVLQALPLPLGVVDLAAPATSDDVRQTARLLGEVAPSFWALSVSPSATWAAVVAGVTLLSVAVASSSLGAIGRTRDVARAVGVAGIAVTLVTLAHEALGADRVYGLYTLPWRPTLLGPLVNENHLAGFLALTVPVLCGLALEAESQPVRVAWAVCAALVTVMTVAVVSRGGLVGLAVGLGVFGALLYRARRREGGAPLGRVQLGAIAAVAAVALGAAAYAFEEALVRDWSATTLDKVRIAIEGLDLLAGRGWIGIGRGAFSEAFVRIHGTGDRAEYPESLPVQWLVEWGWLVGGAILAAMLVAWLSAARSATSPVRMGAVAGVASIAVHDLVDFSLEEPGPAIVAVALFAAVLARPPRSPLEAPAARGVTVARIGLLATALVLGVVVAPGVESARVRTTSARLEALARAGDSDAFASAMRETVRAHPSEPAFPLLAGYEAAVRDDPRALFWLNRAMVLAPEWSAPHLVAARALARRGAIAQAWLEVREAERTGHVGLGEACVLFRATATGRNALETFGGDPAGHLFLDRLVATCAADEAARLEIDAHLEAAGLAGPRLRAAQRLVEAGEHAAALERLADASGTDVATALCRARALAGLERPGEAIEVLRAAHASDDRERRQVLEAVARAQAAMGNAEGMRESVAMIRGVAGTSRASADALVLLGDLERGLGNAGRAMQAYEQAERLATASLGLTRVADLAEELGDLRRAYQAQVELCRRRSADECPAAARLSGRAAAP